MDGFRDSRSTMLWRGIVIPITLLCFSLYNLHAGAVWWPAGRLNGIVRFTANHMVLGTVLVQLGIAGAMHSWYLLANLRRTQRTAQLWMALGLAVSIAGLLTVVIGSIM